MPTKFSAYRGGATDGITQITIKGGANIELFLTQEDVERLLTAISQANDGYEKHLNFEEECGRIRYYRKYNPKRLIGEPGEASVTAEEHIVALLMQIEKMEGEIALLKEGSGNV